MKALPHATALAVLFLFAFLANWEWVTFTGY